MLRQRVITAIVLAALFLGALFGLPSQGWTAAAGLVLLAGAWEWGGFAHQAPIARAAYAAATAGAGFGLAWFLGLAGGRPGALALIPI